MLNRSLFALVVVAAPLSVGCESFGAVSLGASEGIPPVSGSTVINIPQDYQCGDPINDPKYKVESTGTNEACTFTFSQDVTVIKASDYDSRPELKGAQFIERVDFDVNKLGVNDASTGKALDPDTRLKDLKGTAFGSPILARDDIGKPLPFTKSVEGKPIDALKTLVENKQDIVVPVVVTVIVVLDPTPPAQIGLDFDAQPNIVVSILE